MEEEIHNSKEEVVTSWVVVEKCNSLEEGVISLVVVEISSSMVEEETL